MRFNEDEHPDIKFLTLRLRWLELHEEYEHCAKVKKWIDQLKSKHKTKSPQLNITKKNQK